MVHIGIIGPIVAASIFLFTKFFDPLLEYLGISNPSDRKRRLDDHKYAVGRVVALRNDLLQVDAYPSSQQARHWLKRVKELEDYETKLHAKYHNAWRLSYFKKWRCARQAAKEQKRADDLAAQFKDISKEPKPTSQLEGSLNMEPYKTRLFAFIKDKESCLLGIWGMGGVGKSTLLRLISTSRSEYTAPGESFEILLIHAGKDCTVAKLQKAISELLGLDVGTRNEPRQAFAITSYLRDKNFLLLLDDMWQHVNLKLVGIPPPRAQDPRQKIIVTSRMKNLCASMSCGQNIIQMLCPNEEVALGIFCDAVGPHIMKDVRILPLAKVIVEECGRLPDALEKIGSVMSVREEIWSWDYAIELLRESKLHEITNENEGLLDRLKWSYDQLEDRYKPCLLICCLWQEGANIPVDKLIRWWTGMGLITGRNACMEGFWKIRELQNASLLEKGEDGLCTAQGTHLRMHEMVRKMAMHIVNGAGEIWACNSSHRPALTQAKWYKVQKAWASSRDTEVLGWKRNVGLKFPLSTLVTRHTFNLEPIHLFTSIVFLDMEGCPYEIFPEEICLLRNLRYLNLSSTRIAALPKEFTKLSKLKYLDMRDNCALQQIPQGVITKLGSLQEFDLFCTSSMPISSLLQDLRDPAVHLSMIGFTVRTEAEVNELVGLGQVRAVSVCLHGFEHQSINLQMLLEMRGCRELHIVDSTSVTQLVCTEVILPCLHSFEIRNLPNLANVILDRAWLSLTILNVSQCGELTNLTWIQHIINLEHLMVSDCKKMVTVLSVPRAIHERSPKEVSLPKLKKIHLQDLPVLTAFCDVNLQLDSISHLYVFGCESLTRLPVQQDKKTKVRLDCSEAWWNQILPFPGNNDMKNYFSPNFRR